MAYVKQVRFSEVPEKRTFRFVPDWASPPPIVKLIWFKTSARRYCPFPLYSEAMPKQLPWYLRRIRPNNMVRRIRSVNTPVFVEEDAGTNQPEETVKRFILWDQKDGPNPPRDEAGEILTNGCLGRLTINNVYLTSYGARPDGAKAYDELELGEAVRNVRFSLSGSKGEYDVYRVA